MQGYCHTYGLPALICRGSNNYGPYQYPEKLIPLMILNGLHGDPLPVYGDGMQVRNWIHAEDFFRAIGAVLERGAPGEVYNAGRPDEQANIAVVQRIVGLTGASESLIEHVRDRPATTGATRSPRRRSRGARLERANALRGGTAGDRRLVSRERVVVGADPLGRLPRLLQRQYGRSLR